MVTLRDVAARAGVSVSVASRVLNADPEVRAREETRTRVLDAARELAYVPNSVGRSLRRQRSQLLALVVPDVTNATFSDLNRGVESAAASQGYSVVLGSSASMLPENGGLERLLNERRVDGALVQKGDGSTLDDIAAMSFDRGRVVFVNAGSIDGVSTVALDDQAGGALAAQHLLDLGHRRIGLVNGLPSADTGLRRGEGVRTALAEAGLAPVAETTLGYGLDSGRAAAREMLSTEDRPTAIVVANVNAAFGVLLEAARLGIPVPGRLSVVGVHDVWEAEIPAPALTTVRMPMVELGERAVEMLLARLAGAAVRHDVVLDPPPSMVLRASTSVAP